MNINNDNVQAYAELITTIVAILAIAFLAYYGTTAEAVIWPIAGLGGYNIYSQRQNATQDS